MTPAPLDELMGLTAVALADCTFLLSEPADDTGELTGDVVHAVVDLHGVPAARMILSAPRELTVRMAYNRRNVAAHDGAACPESALGELASVLVVALAAHFFGATHRLGVPSVQRNLPCADPACQECAVTLLTDAGNPLRLTWLTRAGAR